MNLSIVIPAYNVEKYIKNTIDTIIKQTEKNFEIIIVNDGSTDNTLDIVNEIVEVNNLSNLKIIDKENAGVSSARNLGINEAVGNYIMFLDGDDLISENLQESLNEILKYVENQPDIICWGYNTIKEDNTTIENYFEKYNSSFRKMNRIETLQNLFINQDIRIWTGSAAYKRDLLLNNSLFFTEGCSNGEDQEFIIKAILKSNHVIFINKILSFYVKRDGSISHSYNIVRFDAITAMRRTYECLDKENDSRLNDISNVIKNEGMIGNYLYNFNSCIRYLFENNKLSTKKSLKYILGDIEKHYPGLNHFIRSLMKSYRGKNRKLKIHTIAFLYFPLTYYRLFKLKKDKQNKKVTN